MARILLADDDRSALDLVRRALEADGHTVATADDGTEAVARLGTAGPFDVLVADVQMPGLDGIAVAATALVALPSIGLVLMSGYPEVLDRARALGGRAVRVLTKPFSMEQMRTAVREVL